MTWGGITCWFFATIAVATRMTNTLKKKSSSFNWTLQRFCCIMFQTISHCNTFTFPSHFLYFSGQMLKKINPSSSFFSWFIREQKPQAFLEFLHGFNPQRLGLVLGSYDSSSHSPSGSVSLSSRSSWIFFVSRSQKENSRGLEPHVSFLF